MRPLEINDSVILVSGKHERYISCGVQKDSLFFFLLQCTNQTRAHLYRAALFFFLFHELSI